MGRGAGNIIYIKASLVQWKDIRLWQPEFGPEKKRTILFLEISLGFLSFSVYFVGRISEAAAAMGGLRSSFRTRRSSEGGGEGCSEAQ
jgi:hypothetical protein